MVGGSTRSTVTEAPSARSAVTSVVVHSSGAVCTRRARFDVRIRDGAGTARVHGLPPTLYEHSVRGRVVSGPAGLRVTDVRLDLRATLRRGDELPRLRLDLEDAEDRRSRLGDRRDRLSAEIAEVAGFRAEPPQPRRGDPPRWAPVESILALAGFVDSRLARLHERLRTVEDEVAQADHDVDVLRHRLDEASSSVHTDRAEPTVTAVLTLVLDGGLDETADDAETGSAADDDDRTETGTATDADTDAETRTDSVEVELEYHVPGATWSPVYQLRLDGRSGAGTLVLRACVAQRTGEDWTGVRLGLSTADLMRRADLPELRSLRIGRNQEEPRVLGWREPPAGLEELFAGYDAAMATGTPQLAPPAEPAFPRAVGAAVPAPGGGSADTDEMSYGAAAFDAAAPRALDGETMRKQAVPATVPGMFVPPPAPAAPAAASFAPQPALAAPSPKSRAAAPRSALTGVGGAARSLVRPVPPAETSPSAQMLDYTRLMMTGPRAWEGRGTLRPGSGSAADALVAEHRHRADAVSRLDRPAHACDVRVSAGSFDYRFDTTAPADVEADGRWHIVPVSEVPVRTEFEYVCVPAVDQSVFGTVLVTNTSPHALLAGPVDVMVDGDFVLTAALPTLAPGQRQAVGVGVAESVRVARRTHMLESTAGLRGGTTVLAHTVEVEVANRFPYPVVVEVRERVPVSDDKDVRIEERRAQPPWAEPDRPLDGQDGSFTRGARVWRVALEPGRTTTLTGGYEIRLPVGKAVVGGNRRD